MKFGFVDRGEEFTFGEFGVGAVFGLFRGQGER